MTLLRLTFFGLLVFMAMPTPNLAGNLSRQRLFYREIPVAEARRGMSKNIRARKAKQTDLQSTGVETDVTDVAESTIDDFRLTRLTDELFGSKSPPLSSVEARESVDGTDTKVKVIVAKKDDEIDVSKVQVVLASREDKLQVEAKRQNTKVVLDRKDFPTRFSNQNGFSDLDIDYSYEIPKAKHHAHEEEEIVVDEDDIDDNNDHEVDIDDNNDHDEDDKDDNDDHEDDNDDNIDHKDDNEHDDNDVHEHNEMLEPEKGGLNIIHPNYNNIFEYTPAPPPPPPEYIPGWNLEAGFNFGQSSGLNPIFSTGYPNNFDINYQAVASPPIEQPQEFYTPPPTTYYQPLIQTYSTFPNNYPGSSYNNYGGGRLVPVEVRENEQVDSRSAAKVKKNKIEISKGEAGKLVLGAGAAYLLYNHVKNQQQQQQQQQQYQNYYNPRPPINYYQPLRPVYPQSQYPPSYSGYGAGYGAGSFFGRLQPAQFKSPETAVVDDHSSSADQQVIILDPYKALELNSKKARSKREAATTYSISTTRRRTNPYTGGAPHYVETVQEDITHHTHPPIGGVGGFQSNPHSRLGGWGAGVPSHFSPGRPTLSSPFQNPYHQVVQRRNPVPILETVDEEFTYYGDDELAPKWGTTVGKETLVKNPVRNSQGHRNNENAGPWNVQRRNPAPILETVDEEFTYYGDDELAPKWGTTVGKETLVKHPVGPWQVNRNNKNVQRRNPAPILETVDEEFTYYGDDELAPKWGTTVDKETLVRTKRDAFLTPYHQVLRRNPVPIAPILEKVDEDFTYNYEPASQRTTTEKVVKEVLVANPVKTSSKTFINPQHLNPEEVTFLTETEEILSNLPKEPSMSPVEIKQLMDEIDSKVEVILAKKVDEIDGSHVQGNLAPRENDEIEQHDEHRAEAPRQKKRILDKKKLPTDIRVSPKDVRITYVPMLDEQALYRVDGFEIQQRAGNSSDKYSISPEKLVLGAGAAYLLYNHVKNQQQQQQQQNYYNRPPPGYGHHQPGPSYPPPSYPQPGYPQPGYPQPGYPQPGPSYHQPTYVQPSRPSRPSPTYTTQTSYPSTSFSSFPGTSGSFSGTSGSFTSGRPSFSSSYPSSSTSYYPHSNYGKTNEPPQSHIEGFAPPGISPVPIGYVPVIYTT